MSLKKAIQAIEKNHVLLVFPILNRKQPHSLWSCLHPRTEMRWEWDEHGSEKVFRLWHLREELSRSGKVVYSKWYRDRATLFSLEIFPAMLRSLNGDLTKKPQLSLSAQEILEVLEDDSPRSTKQIKKICDLQGRGNESRFHRALKELWKRNLIVAFGEVDEGAFPSLAIGATRLIFEDLWTKALDLSLAEAQDRVQSQLSESSLFLKYWRQLSEELV